MRVGLLVLYVHDVSDIFVDLLKMVNYLKMCVVLGRIPRAGRPRAGQSCARARPARQRPNLAPPSLPPAPYPRREGMSGFMATEIAYVSCVLSWVYFRLYQFPFRAIRASFVEPLRLLAKHPRVASVVLGLEWFPPDLPLYTELNMLLFTLLALHVYWFHLFLMIGWRIVNEGPREASRQEYEGDSDTDETGTKEALKDAPAAAGAPSGRRAKKDT